MGLARVAAGAYGMPNSQVLKLWHSELNTAAFANREVRGLSLSRYPKCYPARYVEVTKPS